MVNKVKNGILNVVIAALVILLAVMTWAALEEVSYSSYAYDEDSFYWCLENEDYSRMITMYYTNLAEGKENDKSLQEYYAVANYFEAAADYKLYFQSGETERAEKLRNKMEEAYIRMGDLTVVKNKIDKKLGIE